MTRARLTELKHALEREGWRVEGEFGAHEPFYVERERIVWRLSRGDSRERLDFFLFAPLGGPTERLADLAYVDAQTSGRRLYFDKIVSAQWRESLPAFVSAVGTV
ncbi:hypothetical protein [Lysobacter enzymogenes]|uniref:hypothetical protein n=1 Tax=Lysobacter enzymogenes TaxID=69 RepID=UPI00089D6D33|nr:hypothetical protein [Lysobacter enzymogenes]SDW92953.1 hypothetical protein SAMN05421681_103252 [Lysobacter enzymogenes]